MSPVVTFSPALFEHLSDRIPRAAREAVRRFPLVDQGDFEQEMWLRSVTSADNFARDLEDGNEAFIWRKLKDTCHRYGMADDRDRRARKASAAGYNTYDEVFYTPAMVGTLVAELVQAEFDLVLGMDRATKGVDLSGVRMQDSDDSHDGFMGYLALLTDVKTAYAKLTRHQQDTLVTWYREGSDAAEDETAAKWDREAVAGSMGLTYDALRKRKDRAIRALIHELGGESPYIQKRRGENQA